MSDTEEELLPRTPLQQRGGGKRPRRVSDVIDSMGELGSPASSGYSPAQYSATPTSAGFVTPQRRTAYWSSGVRLLLFSLSLTFSLPSIAGASPADARRCQDNLVAGRMRATPPKRWKRLAAGRSVS